MIRLATVAAFCLCASTALSDEPPTPWHGFYAGGGGAYSTVSVEVRDDCRDWCDWDDYYDYYYPYEEGDGDFGLVGHVGYRFNRFVAVEASYIDTGTIVWQEDRVYVPDLDGYYDNRVEFEATAPEFSVLGIFPFAGRWEIYARIGAGFWEGDSQQRLVDVKTGHATVRTLSDDGVGFLFGVGFGVDLPHSWHARLDMQSLTIDEDILGAEGDSGLDTIALELQYRF